MCLHFKFTPEINDRYYLNAPKYNYCLFCAIGAEGPMTQEKVANYLNLSKMRICQLEKQAIEKLGRKFKKILQLPS